MADLYQSSTKLLLHCDGGDNTTVFTDTSFNPHTVTPVGGAKISTAVSKFGGASAYFDGTGDYLTLDGSSEFAFATGDFTIEFWVYPTVVNGISKFIYDARGGSGDGGYASIYIDPSNTLAVRVNAAVIIQSASALSANTWYHIALTRSGTSTKLFQDGVQKGGTYSDSVNYAIGGSGPVIGANAYSLPGGNTFIGYMDEIRVTEGIARYTANFTPPVAAFDDPLHTTNTLAGAATLTISVASGTFLRGRNETGTIAADFINTTLVILGAWNTDLPAPVFGLYATSHTNIPNSITADLFNTTLSVRGGANTSAAFTLPTLVSTGTVPDTMAASLTLFTSTLSASATVAAESNINLGFVSSTLTARGGANLALGAPSFSVSASGVAPDRANASLGFPTLSIAATGTYQQRGNITLGFFDSYLSYNNIALAGPTFSLHAELNTNISNALAYVMNVKTTESTKYSNFGFSHVIALAGKHYGVKPDGLYLLEGTTDATVAINGTIATKETDLGTTQAKYIPYVYLQSDTPTVAIPFVDAVQKPRYLSSFGGRKIKIARGLEGRYWRFRVENVVKIEGLELLPEQKQRRVK